MPEDLDDFLLVEVLDCLPRVRELSKTEEGLIDFMDRVALLDDAQKVLGFLLDTALTLEKLHSVLGQTRLIVL